MSMNTKPTSPGKGKTAETRRLCSLCGEPFLGMGHNPEPLKRYQDRCCNDCNQTKVIPARMRAYNRAAAREQEDGRAHV